MRPRCNTPIFHYSESLEIHLHVYLCWESILAAVETGNSLTIIAKSWNIVHKHVGLCLFEFLKLRQCNTL